MKTTKIERAARLLNQLADLGFTYGEAKTLQRIERTLTRWGEAECGNEYGCICRDDETNKPYWLNAATDQRTPVADRQAGATAKLAKLMEQFPNVWSYIQGDCRGCALYIGRKDGETEKNLDQLYTRGIAVCID